MKRSLSSLATAVIVAGSTGFSGLAVATPTLEELGKMVEQQQARIAELEASQEATAQAIEEGGANLPAWLEKTSIGGYGEVHYNNLKADAGGKEKDQIDVHRFVLYFAHQYSDKVRFFSEVELEHALAGEGKPGELELEQAFIEVDYAKNHSVRGGVVLMPVGFLNETHEPDTFFGVERNNVEAQIIPTTWWEAGVFLDGEIAEGLSYDLAMHSGLYIDVESGDFKIRSGRQKVAEADASEFAYTGRLKYTGVKGLELSAVIQHQEDVTQGNSTTVAPGGVSATLYNLNAAYQVGGFGLRALYAMWDLDSDIEQTVLSTTPTTVTATGADEQAGYFIEPSYRINEQWGVFARYSAWDNQAGDSTVDTETTQVDFGVNYWITPNVVVKADYQNQSNDDDTKASDGVNLGIGWSF